MARALAACRQSHAAFERRCIPAEPRLSKALIVALRSKYTRYSSLARLVSRAPRHSRRSRHLAHRLLAACRQSHAAFERRCIPAEPRLSKALIVALRSKYTRYSSLARLVTRPPRHSRRSRHLAHRLLAAGRQSHAAFERRCIPAEPRLSKALIVALRSKYTRYSSLARLVTRPPRHSRRSRHLAHRLLAAGRQSHAAQLL